MKLRLISLGQMASQEPVTVQLPKSSLSICRTMLSTRRVLLGFALWQQVEARLWRVVQACGRRAGATGKVTGLELAEVEFVASDAEVFEDVRDEATWHIAGMPGKGDEPVGSDRIGVVPVAAHREEEFAAYFPELRLQLATV